MTSNLPVDPDLVTDELGARRDDPTRHLTSQRTVMLVIGGGGVFGALARYALSQVVRVPAGGFPWSTFWTNITGSLLIGLVLVIVPERFPRARYARPLVATGFIGAYTTFSTYMVDADLLLRSHDFVTAGLYALGSLFAGLAAVFVGIALARLVTGRGETAFGA